MKTYFALILVLLLTFSFNVFAEDWTTTDGKSYKGVTIVKVEADSVTILDSDGGARVALATLPPDLQKKLNYDPAKAQAAADKRKADDLASAKALEQEAALATAQKNQKYVTEDKQTQDTVAKDKEAAANPTNPLSLKLLAGQIQKNVTGGYAVYIAPYEAPVVDSMRAIGGGGNVSYVPKDPYPRIGYDLMVILKTDKTHTVGQNISIPVLDAGTFKDSDGNDYKAFTEPPKSTGN